MAERLEYFLPVHRMVNLSIGALAGMDRGELIETTSDTESHGIFGGVVIEPDLGFAFQLLPRLDLRIEGSYLFMTNGVGPSNGMAEGVTLRWRW